MILRNLDDTDLLKNGPETKTKISNNTQRILRKNKFKNVQNPNKGMKKQYFTLDESIKLKEKNKFVKKKKRTVLNV